MERKREKCIIKGGKLTIKSYTKVLKQIENKPVKKAKFLEHNKPKKRTHGIGNRRCSRCGRFGAHIRKNGLNLCRQCFKDLAKDYGFRKYGHEV